MGQRRHSPEIRRHESGGPARRAPRANPRRDSVPRGLETPLEGVRGHPSPRSLRNVGLSGAGATSPDRRVRGGRFTALLLRPLSFLEFLNPLSAPLVDAAEGLLSSCG